MSRAGALIVATTPHLGRLLMGCRMRRAGAARKRRAWRNLQAPRGGGRSVEFDPEEEIAMIEKTGSARWQGGLKDGQGHVSTQSGALNDQPYGFNTRFEGKPGTNPEELIGAAHAGRFSMAPSTILGQEE